MIYNKNKNVPYTESLKKDNNNWWSSCALKFITFFNFGGGGGVGGWLGAYWIFLFTGWELIRSWALNQISLENVNFNKKNIN